MTARTAARWFTALAIIVGVSAGSVGCSAGASKPTAPLQEPVASLPSGTIPGLELVDVASLPMGEKANIDGWQAGGAAQESAPKLKAKTYKPIAASAHLLSAEVSTDTANGIALKVVLLTFDPTGTKALATYSAKHVGGSFAVVVKGQVIDVLQVSQPITDGKVLDTTSPAVTEALAGAIVPK